jgi:hypothetical protein
MAIEKLADMTRLTEGGGNAEREERWGRADPAGVAVCERYGQSGNWARTLVPRSGGATVWDIAIMQ